MSVESRLVALEKEVMLQTGLNLALLQILTITWREMLSDDMPEVRAARIERYIGIVKSANIMVKAPRGHHPVEGDFVSAHVQETMEAFFRRLL